MQTQEAIALLEKISGNIARVHIGSERAVALTLTALTAGGHVLLQDVPGTGKTLLARTLARSLGMTTSRIQFTPDLVPGDVTGSHIYDPAKAEFRFHPGPVFTNILLADEINRTTPRTQSSLLECMEERQVSMDGETFPLPDPFLVVATQNPVELAGTFPLPEAQLDRFLLRCGMGYPDAQQSLQMIERFVENNPIEDLSPVADETQMREIRQISRRIVVSPAVREYIVALAEATRAHAQVELGVSPRGMLAMTWAAQAYALVQGRDYVLPDDIKVLVEPVFGHRIIAQEAYGVTGSRVSTILSQIIDQVAVPTEPEEPR